MAGHSATVASTMAADTPTPTEFALANFDAAGFLARHWQREPLLVRGALAGVAPGLAAERLLELAGAEDVESRIVHYSRADDAWTEDHGPFDGDVLRALPDRDWTLLVQAVDLWEPQAKAALAAFDFLPPWRLDDIMVSLAAPGGGVGPHVDQYDVFLIQAAGTREWQIGSLTTPGSPRAQSAEDFRGTSRWTVEPGDMLYLPPGVAHWGTALTECQTWSVGFRAPSLADMLGDLAVEMLAQDNDRRFTDPPLRPEMASERVDPAFFERARDMLRELLADDTLIEDWFCRYMTAPKYPELEDVTDETRRASFSTDVGTDDSRQRTTVSYCNGEPEH